MNKHGVIEHPPEMGPVRTLYLPLHLLKKVTALGRPTLEKRVIDLVLRDGRVVPNMHLFGIVMLLNPASFKMFSHFDIVDIDIIS